MSLLSSIIESVNDTSNNRVAYNTGTLFDLATGFFEQGVDGKMYLRGGLGCQLNAFVGPNGNFKSTTAAGLMMRALGICTSECSDAVIFDTENSIDKNKSRIVDMAEALSSNIDPNNIFWLSGVSYSLEKFDEWLLSLCKVKKEHWKDLLYDTPFIDGATGKPIKQVLPTFVLVDSFTEAYTGKEDEKLNDIKSGTTGMMDSNTAFMADGNKKTLWTRIMRRRCEEYGIVLVATGHYDQKMAMDAYHPNPKDTLFGKADWSVKGVGTKFKFLSSIYARTQAAVLQDSNKSALYPQGITPDKDIFEVDILLDRCKVTNAGTITPFVCSQDRGFLNAVTNYHYLRLNDYWGCEGNKQKQQLTLLQNTTISRNTIRDIASSNDQLRRALEISAQLCYIRNNWGKISSKYGIDTNPKRIFDYLISDKNKSLKDEILNSRSYWTPNKKETKPYMSVIDILDKIKE